MKRTISIRMNDANFNCSNSFSVIRPSDPQFDIITANIARAISRSYCGSEISETDIYSPYSFYGSEAGTDAAASDDGWNVSQV